jgi:beta-alanine degradation protein BauB
VIILIFLQKKGGVQCCKCNITSTENVEIIVENESVKVSEFKQEPGQMTGMHLHPSTVVYPFTNGLLKFTYKDGRSEEIEIKSGEPFFRSEQWHDVEDIGDRDMRALIIDLRK